MCKTGRRVDQELFPKNPNNKITTSLMSILNTPWGQKTKTKSPLKKGQNFYSLSKAREPTFLVTERLWVAQLEKIELIVNNAKNHMTKIGVYTMEYLIEVKYGDSIKHNSKIQLIYLK